MKQLDTTCPHCGAKLTVDRKNHKYVCDYCGTEYAMEDSEVRMVNRTSGDSESDGTQSARCRKCGSTKIQYRRERETGSSSGFYYRTTAMCQNCGYTWRTSSDVADAKEKEKSKGRLWLWVLGWICIFPIPLTIIMLRNKKIAEKLPNTARYGIIAAAWIIYILIGVFGGEKEATTTSSTTTTVEADVTPGFEPIPDGTSDVNTEAAVTETPTSLAGTDASDYFSILCTLAGIETVPEGSADGDYTVYSAESDHYKFTVQALTENNEIVSVNASSDLWDDAENFFIGAATRIDYSSEDDASSNAFVRDYYEDSQADPTTIGDATFTFDSNNSWNELNISIQ